MKWGGLRGEDPRLSPAASILVPAVLRHIWISIPLWHSEQHSPISPSPALQVIWSLLVGQLGAALRAECWENELNPQTSCHGNRGAVALLKRSMTPQESEGLLSVWALPASQHALGEC